MIKRVSIRNFKCLRDINVGLERFTVFVGPNASGKSSILQVVDLLCGIFGDLRSDSLAKFVANISRNATEPIEVVADSDGKKHRYKSESRQANDSMLSYCLKNTDWKPWGEQDDPNALLRSVLLQLESSKLADPQPVEDPTVMSPDGSGLHSALANIALSDPDSWQALQERLRQIVPTVRRLRHTMRQGPYNTPALLFDMLGADSIQAEQVSEGTLLVLGLLTALHASGRPNLVLLDDLDRGRERDCWTNTPLSRLRARGSENGLAAYLQEVRDRLAPLIGHVAQE